MNTTLFINKMVKEVGENRDRHQLDSVVEKQLQHPQLPDLAIKERRDKRAYKLEAPSTRSIGQPHT